VYLFPDLSKEGRAFDLWSRKANEIQKRIQGTSFQVSNLLEQLAPDDDRNQGKDIADYLIKQDWRLFRKQEQTPISEKSEAPKTTYFFQSEVEVPKTKQVQDWSQDIEELEKYFSSIELTNQPVKLKDNSTVSNQMLFIESHMAVVKSNNGKEKFRPYLQRLQNLAEIARG